jgi:chlorite dismutase
MHFKSDNYTATKREQFFSYSNEKVQQPRITQLNASLAANNSKKIWFIERPKYKHEYEWYAMTTELRKKWTAAITIIVGTKRKTSGILRKKEEEWW